MKKITTIRDILRLAIAIIHSPDRQWYSIGQLIDRACSHFGIWQEHISNSDLVKAIKRLGKGKP